MVLLEDKFIDLAFEQGGIEGLDKEDVKTYIRFIAIGGVYNWDLNLCINKRKTL